MTGLLIVMLAQVQLGTFGDLVNQCRPGLESSQISAELNDLLVQVRSARQQLASQPDNNLALNFADSFLESLRAGLAAPTATEARQRAYEAARDSRERRESARLTAEMELLTLENSILTEIQKASAESKAREDAALLSCLTYLSGFYESYSAMVVLVPALKVTCVPEGITADTLRLRVLNYADRAVEPLRSDMQVSRPGYALFLAIEDAWPCPAEQDDF